VSQLRFESVTPEYKSEALPLEPICFVHPSVINKKPIIVVVVVVVVVVVIVIIIIIIIIIITTTTIIIIIIIIISLSSFLLRLIRVFFLPEAARRRQWTPASVGALLTVASTPLLQPLQHGAQAQEEGFTFYYQLSVAFRSFDFT
jgi:hypothetical protein